jgi:hypothetical protein
MNLFLFRGTWPVCDILSDEQEQMPMEESANMLLMLAGIVQRINDTAFLKPYSNLMEIWAQYLNSTLPDPGNQLCTDDFVCIILHFITEKISIYSVGLGRSITT